MDSEDEDGSYIVRGTPLSELDEDTILNRKAAQDLTVRDEKGRQRFHGAFTGGFSAGYFNTVGTKEGWEPSNFMSSRSNKVASKSSQQRPEDFMDDEDFGEFGIAPKRIRTTANFSDKSIEFGKSHKHHQDFDAVIPGEPPLKDLVKPLNESIGVAILRKLGWRPGQGIGPRAKRKESAKIVGCSLGPLAPDKVDPFLECFTSAPEDTPEVPYVPKDDLHGIGYSGLSTQSVLSVPLSSAFSNSTKSWLVKDQRKLSIRGQAFGIGALEDDDDGDVYSRDDMSQYDFSEFLGEKSEKSSSDGKKSKCTVSQLPGFNLAAHPPVKKKWYRLPNLPPDFMPRHKSSPSDTAKASISSEVSKHKLNHSLRAVLLGEKPFVKPVQPVVAPAEVVPRRQSRFDEKPSVPVDVKQLPSPQLVTTPSLTIPPLMSIKFKPFLKDPEKQKRYEDFLSHNCDAGFLKSIQPPSLTEWEKQLELDEFARAASFYQPLAKELDSRFESRSHLDVETASGIVQKSELSKETTLENKKNNVPVREIFEWHPTSLLCKRFNVPNPFPDSKIDGVPGTDKKKPSLFDCLSFNEDVGASSSTSAESSKRSNEQVPESTQKDMPMAEVSAEVKDTAEMEVSKILNEPVELKTKPPMDLFKEIFQTSSSEDSDGSDEDTKDDTSSTFRSANSTDVTTTPLVTPAAKPSVPPQVSGVNESTQAKPTRVAFGVFANLDLDALSRRVPTNTVEPTEKHSNSEHAVVDTSEHLSAECAGNKAQPASLVSDCYGPELPPQGVTPLPVSEYVHKQHKHKHKHHKHKEKKRKKKKKHKSLRHKRDTESSSESEEEVLNERIVEKLKKLQKRKS